eukprot:383546_1
MSTSTTLLCTMVVVWFSIYPCFSSYDSTKASSKFPGDDQGMAVAYDNTTDTILLFGGAYNQQTFIQFKDNAFVFTDTTYLTTEQQSFGYGHHYVQQHDQLFIKANGDTIISFQTRPPYQSSLDPIQIPISVDTVFSCLAARDHYLFLAGGRSPGKDWSGADTVQIYDITSTQWLSGVPSLYSPRQNPGCLVMNDVLYVVGGRYSETYVNTIVTLDVSNANIASISQQQWQYLSDTLSKGVMNVKLVGHRTDIIVVGGQSKGDVTMTDVHVIDTIAGNCRVAGQLEVKTECPGVIVHQPSNTLFIFGGYPSSSFDTWQYIVLPTTEPTPQPTTIPTINPTSNPTVNPSNPTINPSDPSNDPTTEPTVDPTVDPTINPTDDPIADLTQSVVTGETMFGDDSDEKVSDLDAASGVSSVVLWAIIGVIVVTCIIIIRMELYIANYCKVKKAQAEAMCMMDNKETTATDIGSTSKMTATGANTGEPEVRLYEENKASNNVTEIVDVNKDVVDGEVSESEFSSEELYGTMVQENDGQTKGFGDDDDECQMMDNVVELGDDGRNDVRVIEMEAMCVMHNKETTATDIGSTSKMTATGVNTGDPEVRLYEENKASNNMMEIVDGPKSEQNPQNLKVETKTINPKLVMSGSAIMTKGKNNIELAGEVSETEFSSEGRNDARVIAMEGDLEDSDEASAFSANTSNSDRDNEMNEVETQGATEFKK